MPYPVPSVASGCKSDGSTADLPSSVPRRLTMDAATSPHVLSHAASLLMARTPVARISDENFLSSPSAILPFLFLGDESDAADLLRLERLGISHILSVTSQPPTSGELFGFTCKRLPAFDSCRQNMIQFFEDAFDFIGEWQQTQGMN